MNAYLTRVSRPMMAFGARGPSPSRLITAMRPGINQSLVRTSPVPRGTTATPVCAPVGTGSVRGEWVSGSWLDADRGCRAPIIYYLHGSGYVVCSPRTHRGLVARLAKATGRAAFSLEYRMAPRYQMPTAGDDAIRGYRWLLDQGWQARDIVLAGDSAGGHLALDVIVDNHHHGLPQPGAMVVFSPLYDPTFRTAVDHQRRGARDPIIDAVAAQRFLQLYTGDAPADHPRMRIEIPSGMSVPPSLIQVGGLEVMADDARALHVALTAAGGESELQVWPDQGHVFQMFPYFSSEARHAVADAARFITEALPISGAAEPTMEFPGKEPTHVRHR